jgi:CDP-diacylglycerol--serine O-phosphatidyltransferase
LKADDNRYNAVVVTDRRRVRHFSMIRDFHLADFFTLANGACGTAAIFLAMDHMREARVDKVYVAGLLVLSALACDFLDGRIARWRHDASPLGRELDSLADVISFGVAPACLAYAVGIRGVWDMFLLLYFVACGISRLARYNITAEALAAAHDRVTSFEGTPIPTSILLVGLLVLLTWLGRIGPALPFGALRLGPFLLHPLVLVFALSGSLMISKTLRVPKP